MAWSASKKKNTKNGNENAEKGLPSHYRLSGSHGRHPDTGSAAAARSAARAVDRRWPMPVTPAGTSHRARQGDEGASVAFRITHSAWAVHFGSRVSNTCNLLSAAGQ